jgi:hypothetical protein
MGFQGVGGKNPIETDGPESPGEFPECPDPVLIQRCDNILSTSAIRIPARRIYIVYP